MSLVPFKVLNDSLVPQSLTATDVYASGSNSDQWASVYTTVNGASANYILDGGNSKGAALTIGTNDVNQLNFETNNSTKMVVTTAGRVGIGNLNPTSMLYVSGDGAAEVAVFESTTVGAARVKLQGVDRSGTIACEVFQVPGGYQNVIASVNGGFGVQNNNGGIAFVNSNATFQYGAIGGDARNGLNFMVGNPGIGSGDNEGRTLMYFTSSFNVGINTFTPNVQFTVNGAVSSNNIIYDATSNSSLWGSTYTTVNANSGSWGGGGTIDTGVRALTSNWQSTYTTVQSNSASWGGGSGSGLTIFKEVSSTASPNNTTTVHALSVINSVTNTDVALIAKGTGATLAQIPDSASTGGNKRGSYATDWQKIRSQASQVASGSRSVIGGGERNTSSGDYATVAGGFSNTASAYDAIAGGYSNNANGGFSTVAGGYINTASGNASTVGGGSINTAAGTYACIPGGYGASAPNFGQYAYASHYFGAAGDGQYVQYILYGNAINGDSVYLSPNNDNTAYELLKDSTSMVAMFTIQILGIDDSDNISQYMRKVVIKKLAANSYNEVITHIESIGTDITDAGAATFTVANNGSVDLFTITGGSSFGDNTRWVANLQGLWVVQPPSYP